VRIVLVTGHAEVEVIERAADAGILLYLLKPVTQRILDAAMRFARARASADSKVLCNQVRDPHLVCKLCAGAGHESGYFLVAHLHEFHVIFRPVESTQDAVDPVAKVSVDPVDSPFGEPLNCSRLVHTHLETIRDFKFLE
jgi:DNA-binding response OmpR family regulator